jgi:DNA-binding transcriptional ArsR family regulator
MASQALLQAVSAPRRREILRLVWDRELSAGEIASSVDVSWPAVSQHLRVLRDSGAVLERRDGTRRLYRADRAALGPLEPVLEAMWRENLHRLKVLAEADEANAGPRSRSATPPASTPSVRRRGRP